MFKNCFFYSKLCDSLFPSLTAGKISVNLLGHLNLVFHDLLQFKICCYSKGGHALSLFFAPLEAKNPKLLLNIIFSLFYTLYILAMHLRLITVNLQAFFHWFIIPPQNVVLGGYTVLSLSVIPSFRDSVIPRSFFMVLLCNFSTYCPILLKFSPHLSHQTLHVL